MSNLEEVPTEELLSFHDYPVVHQNSNSDKVEEAQISVTINDENVYSSDDDINDPLEKDIPDNENMSFSIWSIEFYQKFFDVDTTDVLERIVASITPKKNNLPHRRIIEKPDLYGPFWISVTLVFTIAIGGNISNYLKYQDDNYHWRYDFKLVSSAATIIWIYVLLVPLMLWGFLNWSIESITFNNEENLKKPGLLELICVYGYSLFIYVPISILWIIQICSVQWVLAIISSILSGTVIIQTLMNSLSASRHKIFFILGIIFWHTLLSVGFMLCFFHANDQNIIESPAIVSNLTASMNITKI